MNVKVAKWLEISKNYVASDLNMSDFCYQNNIKFESFKYWLTRVLPSHGYKFDLAEHNQRVADIRRGVLQKKKDIAEPEMSAIDNCRWNVLEIKNSCKSCSNKLMVQEILEVLAKYDTKS